MERPARPRLARRAPPLALLLAAVVFVLVAFDFLYGLNVAPEHLTRYHPVSAAVFYYRVALPHHLSGAVRLLNWHIVVGVAWLSLGLFQLLDSKRAERTFVHRVAGAAYLALGVFGCASALVLARSALGGLITQAAVLALVGAWFLSAWQALRHALAGVPLLHRRWVVRNYAAALAPGLSRPIMSLLHWSFPREAPEVLFPTSFWLAVVLAWLLAEWHLERAGAARVKWWRGLAVPRPRERRRRWQASTPRCS